MIDTLPFRPSSAEQYKLDIWQSHETYLQLPKGFGAVASDQLEPLARQMETSNRPAHLLAAGSALVEATIFSPPRDTHNYNRDALTIEYATLLLQQAAANCWHDLERGFLHPDDQTEALRADIQASYSGIYRNILSGVITEENRQATYSAVAKLGRYCYSLAVHADSNTHKSAATGLTFEIATLLGGMTDNGILLPSTPRAGSGHYNPATTYDFSYVDFDDTGAIRTNAPIELKNEYKLKRRLDAAGRYDPKGVILVHTGRDLNLYKAQLPHIFGHQSLTPSARQELANIKTGLYAKIHAARRRYGRMVLAHCA